VRDGGGINGEGGVRGTENIGRRRRKGKGSDDNDVRKRERVFFNM